MTSRTSAFLKNITIETLVNDYVYGYLCVMLQGTAEEVPMYLRYEGQVRNRRLGKRDLLLLVKDIWREKTVYDAEVSAQYNARTLFALNYVKFVYQSY